MVIINNSNNNNKNQNTVMAVYSQRSQNDYRGNSLEWGVWWK